MEEVPFLPQSLPPTETREIWKQHALPLRTTLPHEKSSSLFCCARESLISIYVRCISSHYASADPFFCQAKICFLARLPVASLDRGSISSASQKKEATQTLIETAKKFLRTRAEVHRNFFPSPLSIFRARGPSSPSPSSEMPVARKVGGGGKGRTSGEPASPGLEEEMEAGSIGGRRRRRKRPRKLSYEGGRGRIW